MTIVKTLMAGAAVAALSMSVCAPAIAQTTTPAESAGLEEVVVTARKTTENLQKAPASITVASGPELQTKSIFDPQQLQRIVPSASLHTQGPVTQTFIRGIGTRSDTPNFSSSSIILFNGIILPRYATGGILFDLDSIQAIAGPQGTLYGGSAAGGAINVNAAQPRNSFSGSGLLEYGSYDEFHAAVNQNLALGETVSLRTSVDYERRDGFQTTGINALNRIQARASLLAKPTDDLSILVFASVFRNNGKPNATYNTIPNRFPDDPWRLPAATATGVPIDAKYTHQRLTAGIYGANVDWKLGDNLFTYIPGYVASNADQGPYYQGGAGNLLRVRNKEKQHSQELRWSRSLGDFQLSAGVFYARDHAHLIQDQAQPRFNVPPYWVFGLVQDMDNIATTYAAFGQAVYSVNDKFRITAGARETRNDVKGSGLSSSKPFLFDQGESHFDWKLGADFDVAPNVLVYGNIQTGFIPLGYNPDTITTLPVTPAARVPRSDLFAISGGFKTRFLDNRLQLNVEGYHYGYDNFQAIAFVTATALSTVLNAKKSTIYGVDINAQALLPFDTTLTVAAVFQRARYDDFAGPGYNYSGNEMINAPKETFIVGLGKTFRLGAFGELLARVDTRYENGHYSNFNNFPNARQPEFTKTDLSLTYRTSGGRWGVQGYINNVSNAVEYGSPSPGATPATVATTNLLAPRTYGVRLTANWD